MSASKQFMNFCVLSLTAATLLAAPFVVSGCSSPTDATPEPGATATPSANIKVTGNGAFGDVTASTTANATFTVTNSGNGAATLDSITDAVLGLSAPFAMTGGTCSTALELTSGQSCTIIITFSPMDASQVTQNVMVKFRDDTDDAEQSAQFTISGKGVLDCVNHVVPACPKPAPSLSISDGPTFNFQSVIVTENASHTFTVTNTGNAAATLGTVSGSALGLSAPYTLDGSSTCSAATPVAANGGTCSLVVVYTPTVASTSAGTITLAYSGSNLPSASATVGITGTGELDCLNHVVPACPPPLPIFTFTDATSSNFGSVNIGTTANATFTLTNGGRVDGKLGTITGLSAPFSIVSGGTCVPGSTTLTARGGSCSLIVSFVPASPGTPSQTMTVNYSGTNGSTSVTRTIYGTAVLDCAANANLTTYFNQGVTQGNSDNATQAAQGTAAGQAAAYQDGYNDGYAATYQAAYNADYTAAYNATYNSDYQGWYNTGYSNSCPSGTSIGTTDGDNAGTSAGDTDGYNAGYNDTYSSSYTDGYNTGYTDGQATCPSGSTGTGGIAAADMAKRILKITQARVSSTGASSGTSGNTGVHAEDGTTDPTNEQACYNQGYTATYNTNAYQNAYNTAVKTSPKYTTGYQAGTNQADLDAQIAGTSKGDSDGSAAAQTDGTAKGDTDGYNSCYTAAYNSNYSSAYTDAYNADYTTGSDAGDSDGNAAGYPVGYAAGVAACPSGSTGTGGIAASEIRAMIPTTYANNQKWMTVGPNGIHLDLFVEAPMRHGTSVQVLNRALRSESRARMSVISAPALRLKSLARHRAGQATLK